MNYEEKIDKILEEITRLNSTRLSDGYTEVAEKKIDGLGRITLPIALRRELGIDDNTRLKIYRNNDEIIIKKD